MSDKRKRLIRELQALRGCSYTAALDELRELPTETSWAAYIDLVRKQSTEPSP